MKWSERGDFAGEWGNWGSEWDNLIDEASAGITIRAWSSTDVDSLQRHLC